MTFEQGKSQERSVVTASIANRQSDHLLFAMINCLQQITSRSPVTPRYSPQISNNTRQRLLQQIQVSEHFIYGLANQSGTGTRRLTEPLHHPHLLNYLFTNLIMLDICSIMQFKVTPFAPRLRLVCLNNYNFTPNSNCHEQFNSCIIS